MKLINKFKINWRTSWPYFLIFAISILVMIPQWHAQAAFVGLDSIFHMNRFYDAMMQIKTGQYSYFQSFFGFGQSGRVVNAVYGPIFAYFNGLILLLAKNWVNYQLISSIILFWVCGWSMYRLGIKNQVKTMWALVMAIAYMFSTPILYWINGQQFTAWGAAFVPLLMLMGTEMMRERKVAWIKLALSMTLVLQIHNVTSAICAMALLPFFVVGLIHTDQRRQMWIDLGKAIGLTLMLSANVWGAMLELFTSNHLLQVVPDLHLSRDALYFIHGETKLAYTTLVLFLMAGGYLIVRWRHLDLATKVIICNGLFFLWIPSHFFPWKLLSNLVPAVDSIIQNPIRFLVIPYVLLYLAVGILLSDESIKWPRMLLCTLVTLLAVLVMVKNVRNVQHKVQKFNGNQVVISNRFSTFRTTDPNKLRAALRSHNLRAFLRLDLKATPDYLPVKHKISMQAYEHFKPYTKYRHQIIEPNLSAQRMVKNGAMHVDWTNYHHKTKLQRLPIVKYAHSIVMLNGKRVTNAKTSSIGALIVKAQPGQNHLTIKYQSARWFIILIYLSLVSWLLLIIYGLVKLIKR